MVPKPCLGRRLQRPSKESLAAAIYLCKVGHMNHTRHTHNGIKRSRKMRRSTTRKTHPKGAPGPYGPPAIDLVDVRPVPFTALSQGAVVYAYLPYEEDNGQGKSRPAVVLSATKSEVTLLPITSKGHWAAHHAKVAISDLDAAGLDRPSWIQPRLVVIERRYINTVLGRLADTDAAAALLAEVA
jgi:hypothetical protein